MQGLVRVLDLTRKVPFLEILSRAFLQESQFMQLNCKRTIFLQDFTKSCNLQVSCTFCKMVSIGIIQYMALNAIKNLIKLITHDTFTVRTVIQQLSIVISDYTSIMLEKILDIMSYK